MDREYWSWIEEDQGLLGDVLLQLWDACWGIAPTRQLEALYRRMLLHRSADVRLSIQETLDLMSRTHLEDQRLGNIAHLIPILKDSGTVLEQDNPLTYHYRPRCKTVRNHAGRFKAKVVVKHNYFESNFEELLLENLKVSPVAANLIITEDYGNIVGRIPYQTMEEEVGCHLLLITGYGIDCNGVSFWEAQDSYGITKGDYGFIRIVREFNMISDFFEMKI